MLKLELIDLYTNQFWKPLTPILSYDLVNNKTDYNLRSVFPMLLFSVLKLFFLSLSVTNCLTSSALVEYSIHSEKFGGQDIEPSLFCDLYSLGEESCPPMALPPLALSPKYTVAA